MAIVGEFMRRALVRVGLMLLALGEGLPTLWAAIDPLGFYLGFPTPSRHWITLFPPYNEHLVRDFGLVALQFAVILAYASFRPERRLVRVAALSSLVFNVPHLIYHQRHVIPMSDVAAQVTSQVLPIVIALAVLALNEASPRRSPS